MTDDPSAGYFAPTRPPAPGYPGAGPWPAAPPPPVAARARPWTVVAAAAIAFVHAGFAFLGAAAIAVLAVGTRSALSHPSSNLSGLPVVLGVIAVLIAGTAGLLVLAGLNLLRGRPWAAALLGVIEGLVLVGSLGGMTGQAGVGSMLGAGVSGGVLVLLALPRTREFVGIPSG